MKVGDFLYKPTEKGIKTLKIEKVGNLYYTVNGDKIRDYFSIGRKFNLSLEQLKQIKQIIDNELTK